MRLARLVVPLVLAAALPGCVVVAAGAAGYGAAKYFGNGENRTYAASVDAATAAAVESLRAEGYPVASEVRPGPTGIVLNANDAKVDVAKVDDATTRVSVTVGTFSSEDHAIRARAILDGVSRRLGYPTP